MPHITVKIYVGRAEAEKNALAEQITQAVVKTLHYGAESVSVSIEDIEPKDWNEKVYRPDIVEKPGQLYKKPGYTPLGFISRP